MANNNVDQFKATYLPVAEQVGARIGVDPSTLLGQWGLETGWGRSVIPGTNNLGNIKDFSGTGVTAKDNMNGSVDKYRTFETPEAFGDHYAGLIERKYKGAIGAGADAAKFFNALKAGGYAEDADYVNKGIRAAGMVGGFSSGSSTLSKKTDLSAYEQQGFGDIIARARGDGFSDADIATRLGQMVQARNEQAAMPDMNKLPALVTDLVQRGMPSEYIVGKLGDSPYGFLVKKAQENGFSSDDIVNRLGGEQTAVIKQAQQQVSERGAIENTLQGAKYGLQDMAAGAQQIGARITGDDARLAQLQGEQRARAGDVLRQATLDRTSGAVGSGGVKAAPSVAAGLLTGGASVPAQIAVGGAVGAASGAFEPTTGEGQFAQNIGFGALGGAAGGAAGGVAANAPRSAIRAGQSYLRGGEDVATVAARKAAAEAAGVEGGAATFGSGAARMANTIENNVPFATVLGADKRGLTDSQLVRAITREIGHESDTINSGTINAARSSIKGLYDDALDGVHLPLGPQFTQELDNVVQSYSKNTLPSLMSKLPGEVADDLKALSNAGNISAKQLQDVRSSIGKTMASPATEPTAKQALGGLYDAINNVIEKQLPAANLAKFQQANAQWRALQPVEKMVVASGDSGNVTARQMLNAIKSGKLRDAFETGRAPFQDLVTAVQAGETKGASLPFNAGPATLSAAAVLHGNPAVAGAPIAANLAMRILTDPKYTNVLLGLTPVQRNALVESAKGALTGGAAGAGAQAAIPDLEVQRSTPGASEYAKALRSRYAT